MPLGLIRPEPIAFVYGFRLEESVTDYDFGRCRSKAATKRHALAFENDLMGFDTINFNTIGIKPNLD